MSKQGSGQDIAAIVEETLAIPRYRGRRRHLLAFKDQFSPGLLYEFVARAHVVMQEDAGEAAQCARLGELVARELDDEEGRLDALRVLAHACILQGRFPFGLRALEAAGVVMREHDEYTRLGELDLLRSNSSQGLEHYDELQSIGRRCVALFDERGDRDGMVRTHMAMAGLALRVERARDALQHYGKVDALMGRRGSPRFGAVLAANRANALIACRRFRAAARHMGLARDVFQAHGCDHTVARVDYNAAYAEALRGRHDVALRRYARAAVVFERLQDVRALAMVDLNRAEIHLTLRRPDEARRLAARARRRFAALQLHRDRARATLLGGRASEMRDDLEAAEAFLRRAGAIYARLGLVDDQAGCAARAGYLALRRGRLADAHKHALRGEALLGGRDESPAAAALALLRGHIDVAEGNTSEALQRADKVRVRFRGLHAPWIQSEAQRLEGRAYEARNEPGEAIFAYKYAIEELEGYCGDVPSDVATAFVRTPPQRLYGDVIGLMVRTGHFDEAFAFAQRAKSRAIADLLDRRPRGELPLVQDRRTARRLHRIRRRLDRIYRDLAQNLHSASGRGAADRRTRARDLERELRRFLDDVRRRDREAVSLEAVDTLDLASARDDLDPDTVLLDYLVTEKELFIFVVTPRSFRVVVKDVPALELQRHLERFRFHLTKFDQKSVMAEELVLEATRSNLTRLAKHILAPVSENLEGSRLVISPHGILRHVPFHALPWGDRGWVADRFEVVYAPSAAAYGYARNKATNESGPSCIFGLPDETAPHVEHEARVVARALASEQIYLGEAATYARLRAAARRAHILHLATECVYHTEQPLLSAVRLADTWLRLQDLYRLDVNADLVVLSTGESAELGGGDEILALTRGFLHAGARSLLASRWRVRDDVGAELLDRFYHHRTELGDEAAALKETMAEIRERHPHPYYWASFFVSGRPRSRAKQIRTNRHTRATTRENDS